MMLGLTREDWQVIADLVKDSGNPVLLSKIGDDGWRGHEASMRLFNAGRESLLWWEDSHATVGCDEGYINNKIKESFGDDTVRIVKMLRAAVNAASQ